MEDGGFVACTKCSRRCKRIHGKSHTYTHTPPSSLSPSCFFKVMLGDFAQRSRIPPAFVAQLRNGSGIDEHVVLRSPSDERWLVKVCSISNGGFYFVQGWEKFVSDNEIELGDFLVFQYMGRSCFRVRIFGRSACEKRSPALGSQGLNTQQYHYHENISDQAEPRSTTTPCGEASVGGKKKKKKKQEIVKSPGNEEKIYQGVYYVSCRRFVTQAEREKALEDAKSFVSDKPSYLLTMKQSHVYQGFWVNFPGDCLQLPRERTQVTLVDPNEREWNVLYLGNRKSPGLSGGWRYFSLHNNIEEGDVCVFELLDNNQYKLSVHIFRVIKECTPYKRMEGSKKMNGSITSPTNHSALKMKVNTDANKKMKVNSVSRQDVVLNLSAKGTEPERKKDAKQEISRAQGKKKKANARDGSNCLQPVKSIGRELVLLPKNTYSNGSRRSLRLAQNCKLVESPKQDLLSSAASDEQKSIGRELVVLPKNNYPNDVNGEEEDLMIIWDSNNVSHAMPPTSGALILSEESIYEGHAMIKPVVAVLNSKPVAVSLKGTLPTKETASQVHSEG